MTAEYVLSNSGYFGELGVLVIGIALLLIVAFFMSELATSRSRKYREFLVDLYVVGMIKKFAKKDDLDLLKEAKEYQKITRRANLRDKGLSEAIEDNLKESVAEASEKNLEKKGKKE